MINDSGLNHILFADDLSCFSPSLTGLRDIVNVCNAYACSHDTVFNYCKSVGVLFFSENFKLSKPPFLLFGFDKVEFVVKIFAMFYLCKKCLFSRLACLFLVARCGITSIVIRLCVFE